MATQTTTQTSTLPDWISTPWKDIIDRAVEESNRGYQPYPGQRLAPLTSDQVWAQNLVRNSVGRSQPLLTEAGNLAKAAAAANTEALAGRGPSQVDPNRILGVNPMKFTDLNIDAYMNPYDDAVVQDVLREANKQAQVQQNRAKQAATASRAFGGSRGALLETETAANSERSIQDLVNRLKAQSFESARQTGEADLGRQYSADSTYAGQVNDTLKRNADAVLRAILGSSANVGALSNAARAQSAVSAADAAALQGIGAQNQGMNQRALDLAVQDYMRQQGYTWEQIQKVLGVLTGAGAGQRTTTTEAPGPDLLSQYLGLGISGAGALGKYTNVFDWLGDAISGGSGVSSGVQELLNSIDNGSFYTGAAEGLGEWLQGF